MKVPMSSNCIYCSLNPIKCTVVANSKEHFLPRGLGNFDGNVKLEERLCNTCNNSLGKLDEVLVRSNPIAILRTNHDAKGRSKHTKTNPFYDRSHGHPPVTVHGQSTEDVPFRIEVLENNHAQPLRILEIGSEQIPVPDWAIESPDSLKDFVRSKAEESQEGAQPRITYPESDPEFLEVLQKAYGENIEFISTKPDLFIGEFSIDAISYAEISKEARRAIAKIGFHFFLWAFQETFSGVEPYFDEVKQYIWGKTDSHEIVTLKPSLAIVHQEPTLKLYTPSYVHVLTAGFDGRRMLASVQLFSDSSSGMKYHLITDQGFKETCDSIEWQVKVGESLLIIPLEIKRYGFVGNSGLKQGFEGKMVRL